ncbi:MAG: protein kinase domain-containing protein [Verrucomicrobiia bacterium]
MNTELNEKRCQRCGAIIPEDAPRGLCPKCLLSEVAAAKDVSDATATSEIPSFEKIKLAFPQLEIIELIGKGGMGFVYKARQPNLDRFVALKILPNKLARDPLFAERFNREGRVLAKLNHPNIVAIYDFGQAGEFYYLLMEYVDGLNLRQAMQLGKFSPTEALRIVPQICEALQYAHLQGILHRDIKPENILIDAQGNVKITDFGIAKLIGEHKKDITLTGTGTVLGTPHYMAPEQIETPNKVDQRADIYSLGVVFYEMLTGELPLGRFEPPSAKTPVSKAVDEVVFKSLERDKEKRFKSAQEVKTKVEHISESPGGESISVEQTVTQTAAQPQKLSPYALWSASLTGFGMVLFLILFLLLSTAMHGISITVTLFAILPGLLFCVAGMILGWIALGKMRAEPGRWIGLPLAVFGVLAFPLTTLTVVLVGFPYMMLITPKPSLVVNIVALTIPCIVLAFAMWAVMKTKAWAKGEDKIPAGSKKFIVIFSLMVFCVMLLMRFVSGEKDYSKRYSTQTSALSGIVSKSPIADGGDILQEGVVEVVGICDAKNPNLWWSSDGRKRVDIDAKRFGDQIRFGQSAGNKDYLILWRFNRDEKGAGISFVCPGSESFGYANELNDSNCLLHVSYPKDIGKAERIYVGVADGEWETIAEAPRGVSASSMFTRDGLEWKIAFFDTTVDINSNINQMVSCQVKNANLYQFRIVGITSDRTELMPVQSSMSVNIKAVFKKEKYGEKLDDIKKFRLQIRKYRWATFDVALSPEFIKLEK